MILLLCTLSEPKVRQPWQNQYSQSSMMILSLGPFSGAVSAQGPFSRDREPVQACRVDQRGIIETALPLDPGLTQRVIQDIVAAHKNSSPFDPKMCALLKIQRSRQKSPAGYDNSSAALIARPVDQRLQFLSLQSSVIPDPVLCDPVFSACRAHRGILCLSRTPGPFDRKTTDRSACRPENNCSSLPSSPPFLSCYQYPNSFPFSYTPCARAVYPASLRCVLSIHGFRSCREIHPLFALM